jgi:hypothetical protein
LNSQYKKLIIKHKEATEIVVASKRDRSRIAISTANSHPAIIYPCSLYFLYLFFRMPIVEYRFVKSTTPTSAPPVVAFATWLPNSILQDAAPPVFGTSIITRQRIQFHEKDTIETIADNLKRLYKLPNDAKLTLYKKEDRITKRKDSSKDMKKKKEEGPSNEEEEDDDKTAVSLYALCGIEGEFILESCT